MTQQKMLRKELFEGVVWTAVDNAAMTVAKARIFEWMIQAGEINPSVQSVRAGITQCFGAGSASEANIFALLKRNATLLESIFAITTNGNGAEATPARIRGDIEGPIDVSYLKEVMGW